MADLQISPISQLLQTLGLTKEDLERRSNQMRQFLTAEDVSSVRVADRDNTHRPTPSDLRSLSKPTSSTSSSSRSRSRTNSYSFRDSTPPMTPIKSESAEGSLPPRHFDSMEMVIERQRRQSRKEKKDRREKERVSTARTSVLPHPSSPSPSNTSQNGFNLDTFMHLRDGPRTLLTETQYVANSGSFQPTDHAVPPITPQRSKYYRDHTVLSADRSQHRKDGVFTMKAGSPTPTRANTSLSQSQPQNPPHYAYPQYLTCAQFPPPPFGTGQTNTYTNPVTPQHNHTYMLQRNSMNSPLPPSSPPPTSSPMSTPNRQVVNLVSSPGPMGPIPDEEEYDTLPYTLPPGPYSPNKPDLSYAALVGRAILSSPEHRLTLQEIYDWITIVYPHFKRGEQTWMNSIRHVLSTTVCFRKVPRERTIGRTQWAIFDEDLECFKGGGFRKQLCKDLINGTASKDKQVAHKTKKGKKRTTEDADPQTETRKTKKPKKDSSLSLAGSAAPSHLTPTLSSHPLFPPTRPTPHHQPYYESLLPQSQPLPADIIFPPLPPGVGYTRYINNGTESSFTRLSAVEIEGGTAEHQTPPMLIDDLSAASSSIPELTPNRSSSSPLSSESNKGLSAATSTNDEDIGVVVREGDDSDHSALGTARFWSGSVGDIMSGLQPSIKLTLDNEASEGEDEGGGLFEEDSKIVKGSKRRISFPPVPTSPSVGRKGGASRLVKTPKASVATVSADTRPRTPPPPSTPPRNTRQLPTSSIRTPLAEKDLSINPAALSTSIDDDQVYLESETHRTPRKRLSDSGLNGPAPVTPRRLVFQLNQNDSPFRTPGYVYGTSPFRTPGSRAVFDPHDPGALLEEELSRMGAAGHGDSPAGLFGKGRGSLLYDSPGLHSPSQWQKWW